MSQSASIPIPPSANDLWRIVWPKGGRPFQAKTSAYKSWLEAAAMMLRCGMEPATSLPVAVLIEITGGSDFPRSRDVDNCIKPIVDAIRAAGIVPNDRVTEISDVRVVYLPRVEEGRPAACRVTVSQLERSLFA